MTEHHTKTLAFTTLDILQLKKIDDYENIYRVNPLYLNVNYTSRYFEEKNESKYLIFGSTDKNRYLFKKYSDVWSGIKNKIEAISSGECDYEKFFLKISSVLMIIYH